MNTVAQYWAELGNNNSIALWFTVLYCFIFSKKEGKKKGKGKGKPETVPRITLTFL